jgi:hypothetical protein
MSVDFGSVLMVMKSHWRVSEQGKDVLRFSVLKRILVSEWSLGRITVGLTGDCNKPGKQWWHFEENGAWGGGEQGEL